MVRIGRAVARLRFRFRHLSRTAVAAWLDDWAWTEGRWYAASAAALAGLLLLLLIPWKAVVAPPGVPRRSSRRPAKRPSLWTWLYFHLGDAPLEPSELNARDAAATSSRRSHWPSTTTTRRFLRRRAGGRRRPTAVRSRASAAWADSTFSPLAAVPGLTAGAASAAASAWASIPAAAAPASASAPAAAGIATD